MARIGNNPLEAMGFDAETERKALGIDEKKLGRKRKENIVREKGVQQGLTEEWTRATFIIKVETLETLKDYAYTERITIKEAVQAALDQFIEGIDTEKLLKHR